MVEKEFLCMKEAAQMLGVNERTMKKIIINNGIHATKLNGNILINKKGTSVILTIYYYKFASFSIRTSITFCLLL